MSFRKKAGIAILILLIIGLLIPNKMIIPVQKATKKAGIQNLSGFIHGENLELTKDWIFSQKKELP